MEDPDSPGHHPSPHTVVTSHESRIDKHKHPQGSTGGFRLRESLIIGGVVPDGGRDSVFGLGSRLVVAVVAF